MKIHYGNEKDGPLCQFTFAKYQASPVSLTLNETEITCRKCLGRLRAQKERVQREKAQREQARTAERNAP